MLISKVTLYDVEWQALRVSLKGNWGTVEGVGENINKLQTYLNQGNGYNRSRYWRVLNLLNATRMGYSGSKLEGSVQDRMVAEYRNLIQKTIAQFGVDEMAYDAISEMQIRRDWSRLDKRVQAAIIVDLSSRLKKHDKSEHRDELRWFLSIVTGFAQ